jgi:protein-disulfide isomerase
MRSTLATVLLLALVACQEKPATAGSTQVAPSGPAPAAATAPAGTAAAEVVASWTGGSLSYADASKDISISLLQMQGEYLSNRYDAEMNAVDEKVNKSVAELEAKKRNITLEELMKKEIEEKVSAPTEPEIQDAYNQLQRKFRGRPLEEVRPDVERAVTQKKQGERYAIFMEDLRKSYGVNVTLPFPDMPRIPVSADDDPSEGSADAPVTIIQFAEFQCPYCGAANQTVQRLLKDYDGKVRFVFRDFPLGFHENAIPAAVAANCANQQSIDKYWKFHDSFMANQKALTEADIQKAAQEAGVDTAKWEACRKDPAIEAEVRKDQEDGAAVGVTGTPAFFINGIFLNGAQPYEKFKMIIDAELAKKG